jgi:hypothetical protein
MKTLLWIFAVSILALYVTTPILDPDLWWHIAIGRWIIANHEVPIVEQWNYFGLGKPFTAYSWLFEICVALIYDSTGILGLFVTKIVLALILAFTLCLLMSRLAGDYFIGLLLGSLSFISCYNHFTLRPQSITWVLFAILLLVVNKAFEKDRIFPEAISVFFILMLWANLHITAIFGLIVILFWYINEKNFGNALLLLLAGFIGTLCTPYLGTEWLILFGKSSHPFIHGNIAEFQPATILQYSTGFLLFGVFFAFILFHFAPRTLIHLRAVAAAIFCIAGIAVVKFLPLAAILVYALVADMWGRGQQKGILFGNFHEALGRLKNLIFRLPKEGLGFILVCLLIVQIYQIKDHHISYSIVPVTAVDFMAEKNLPEPWLSTFGYGGYLMAHYSRGRANPEKYVFIDGRTNVTPPEFFKIHNEANAGLENWQQLIKTTQPGSILWRGNNPFVTLLLESGEWCVVFEDVQSQLKHTVLVKRSYFDDHKDNFNSGRCLKTS